MLHIPRPPRTPLACACLRTRIVRPPAAHKDLKLLYTALVLPIIEYRSVVWDPSTAILKAKLERVQNYSIQHA